MRVVYPFTVRRPEVVAAAPAGAEWFDVSADGDAYWRLMCDVWERAAVEEEDVLVVEHDVICRPDVLAGFDDCPEPWCAHPYTPICHEACMEAWANLLGCTRFRAELIAAVPDAVLSIPPDQRLWNNLCDSIAGDKIAGTPAPLRPGSVRAAGFTHHWHRPGVRHRSWEPPIGAANV